MEAADRFQKDLARVSLQVSQAKQAFVVELLPALNNITTAFVNAQRESGLFAGVIAGIQTALTGTDRFKNDKELFELTGRQFELENKLMALRAQPANIGGAGQIMKRLQSDLDQVNARLQTTLAYRKLLDEADERSKEAMAGGGAAAGAPDAGAAEARIRELMAFEKHYAERIAAARGFATRYGDAIQLQNRLADEAGRQGILNASELIVQVAANEDARLQVLVRALNEERALHIEKGELAQAKIAQEKAAAAESARIANETITQARLSSLSVVEEQKSAQAQIAHEKRMADQVQRIFEENMTERDLLAQHLEDKRLQLEAWAGEDLIRQEIANEQLELLEIQHQARLGNIHAQGVLARRVFEEKNEQQKLQFALSMAAQMLAGVANTSRTMFNLHKAAALAEAIVSLPKGVELTWDSYPYPGTSRWPRSTLQPDRRALTRSGLRVSVGRRLHPRSEAARRSRPSRRRGRRRRRCRQRRSCRLRP